MGHTYSSKGFLKGAMILTMAALLTKLLSAVYRIPFQNIVGDIGFYIYQQVYPFYGIALALSTYGFPVIISKMVAEKVDRGDQEGAKKVAATSFIFLLLVGVIWFVAVYAGADIISTWMGDPQLAPLIRVISLSFLLLAPLSVLRGYHQGKEQMVPTAVSQVAEQSVRVVTILVSSTVLLAKGNSLYAAGQGALFGSITGGLAAVIVLVLFTAAKKEGLLGGASFFPKGFKGVWTALMKDGTAICVSAMLLVLLQFVDSLNVYALLTAHGVEEGAAKTLKGVYDRGQPFIQLGTVAATSISLTIVPLVTTAYLKGKKELVRDYSQLALKISILIGFAATLGLVNIMVPTNTMLFENADGSSVLAVFSLSIFFSCLILTFSGILQGIGRIYYPAAIIIGGIPIKFILNMLLIPVFGVMGASLSTVLTLGLITIGLVVKMKRLFGINLITPSFYKSLFISGAGMTLVLQGLLLGYRWLLTNGAHERMTSAFFALAGVAVGAVVFLLLFLRGGHLSEEEISFLPFGSKMNRVKKGLQPRYRK
ncbi:polysaccharide biosynthesis protein [Rossellomorea marisflavi]|uniref:putative polysaccharide biosynthesis protein n=1 Tax=Rossellomorea marisflavi TaxID=189381 RepID=UPI000A661F69|nr:polysaccharide biosynthesis protein [Rossellomorea marisflavi]